MKSKIFKIAFITSLAFTIPFFSFSCSKQEIWNSFEFDQDFDLSELVPTYELPRYQTGKLYASAPITSGETNIDSLVTDLYLNDNFSENVILADIINFYMLSFAQYGNYSAKIYNYSFGQNLNDISFKISATFTTYKHTKYYELNHYHAVYISPLKEEIKFHNKVLWDMYLAPNFELPETDCFYKTIDKDDIHGSFFTSQSTGMFKLNNLYYLSAFMNKDQLLSSYKLIPIKYKDATSVKDNSAISLNGQHESFPRESIEKYLWFWIHEASNPQKIHTMLNVQEFLPKIETTPKNDDIRYIDKELLLMLSESTSIVLSSSSEIPSNNDFKVQIVLIDGFVFENGSSTNQYIDYPTDYEYDNTHQFDHSWVKWEIN